ncbi:unnamed protein product, partial [Linum tenue]
MAATSIFAAARIATLIAAISSLTIAARSHQQQQPSIGSSAAASVMPPNPMDCANDIQKVPDCMDQI